MFNNFFNYKLLCFTFNSYVKKISVNFTIINKLNNLAMQFTEICLLISINKTVLNILATGLGITFPAIFQSYSYCGTISGMNMQICQYAK